MYYTHHFAHHETLSRALLWLTQIGFAPERIEAHTDGIPRLSLTVAPARRASVEMLINAAERSDPHGWPGLWDVANQPHLFPVRKGKGDASMDVHPRATVIGWHPPDAPVAASQLEAVREAG